MSILNLDKTLLFNFSAFSWPTPVTTHGPVAGFTKDPFLNPPGRDRLPDVITQATMDFFYK